MVYPLYTREFTPGIEAGRGGRGLLLSGTGNAKNAFSETAEK
jgi:hypothetical protein